MGSYTPAVYAYNTNGGNPNYIISTGRYTGGTYKSYSDITTGVGTVYGNADLPGQNHVYLQGYSLIYNYAKYLNIALDLRGYMGVKFTSATFRFRVYDHTALADPTWMHWENVSTYDDLVLTGMDESDRSLAHSWYTDHPETADGFGAIGAYSDFVSLSSMTDGVSSTWTLNSAGLAYLNTVATKSDLQGYAYIAMVWSGQMYNVAPTYTGSRTQGVSFDFDADTLITLNFSTPIYINVGDDWKEVVGVYINQTGSAWKYVSDVSINVGDSWKDIDK